jgi:DNA mismatch repair ATPase MutS
MKALLLHRDRDFDIEQQLPSNEPALTQDLELETLFRAMAADDEFLLDVARKVMFSGLKDDVATILYRQEILKDCLKNQGVIRELYDLAGEAVNVKKKHYFGLFSRYPGSILQGSVGAMQMLMSLLRKLRERTGEYAIAFESEGLRTLVATLQEELSDEYLASIQNHLTELRLRRGVLLSAELGRGNQGINYVLRKMGAKRYSRLKRLLGKRSRAYTFHIAPRDDNGARALSELRDRGLNLVANALVQSVDHILSFFVMLRTELAFYVGCMNLHGELAAKRAPVCFPGPAPAGVHKHRFYGLYDVCLALTMTQAVVGNALDADGKSLIIITGANQGGKSCFLRGVGLAQLMMQCGMFVAAESFDAELCSALFTHYKREEDPTMTSGKLDEELARMSDIVDHLVPNSVLLFNESFAATNEREGSEIARQVVCALLEKRIKIFFVTHLYAFARGLSDRKMEHAAYLRAERRPDGTRTFKLIEAAPLETSYGEDLYERIFPVEERNLGREDLRSRRG